MALGPGEEDDRICVTMTALCISEEQVIRVAEAFARVQLGLALEGINLNMGLLKVGPETTMGPLGPLEG